MKRILPIFAFLFLITPAIAENQTINLASKKYVNETCVTISGSQSSPQVMSGNYSISGTLSVPTPPAPRRIKQFIYKKNPPFGGFFTLTQNHYSASVVSSATASSAAFSSATGASSTSSTFLVPNVKVLPATNASISSCDCAT